MPNYKAELAKLAQPSLRKVYVATTNANKFKELRDLADGIFDLEMASVDMSEIQGTLRAVVEQKARDSQHASGGRFPLLVDDTALALDYLRGFPGVYIKDFLKAFGPKDIADLVNVVPDKNGATAQCALAFVPSEDQQPIVVIGEVAGNIHARDDGVYQGFGFDPVFYPTAQPEVAFSDLTTSQKSQLSHRAHAFLLLVQELAARKIL